MPLSDEDVLCIVRTLEYDGIVEAVETEDGEMFRLARMRIPEATPFTRFPCGVCSVRPSALFGCSRPCNRLPAEEDHGSALLPAVASV